MATWFRLRTLMPATYDPSWFAYAEENEGESYEDMQENSKTILRLVQEQIEQAIPANRVVLAGFSQGEYEQQLQLFTL